MKIKIAITVFTVLTFGFSLSHAGDLDVPQAKPCESRFKGISSNIKNWIFRGGGTHLDLPNEVPEKYYETKMTDMISTTEIECNEEPILENKPLNWCSNFRDATTGKFRIKCNSKAFLAASEPDQYLSVHHQYAQLMGLEADPENMDISDQIPSLLGIHPAPIIGKCNDINHSVMINPGTKCVTSHGMIWERVSKVNFGEAWRGPDGVIWTQQFAGNDNHFDSMMKCSAIGGSLPSKTNFNLARANDFNEIILIHTGANDLYWTSTLWEKDGSFAYGFYLFSNDGSHFLERYRASQMLFTLCVSK